MVNMVDFMLCEFCLKNFFKKESDANSLSIMPTVHTLITLTNLDWLSLNPSFIVLPEMKMKI